MILHERERKISKDIAFECNNRRERMYDGEAGFDGSCAALFHNAVSITTVSQSPVPGTYTLIPASEQGNAYRLLNGIIIAFSDNIITINIPGNGIFSIIGSFIYNEKYKREHTADSQFG
ncbi:hypothetical protein [Sporomusa sp. KB1]|jgi:hypothetical protein|uniref:hypothetical protein n=1 Tax=Sporomusa sp. KB1 TaxID=943346 RepID=UPI00119F3D05|nr:hypothetical protein [Sporomusa sp. KB1]TWH45780.1 hypothetical protein Salpa_1706 [Sporomusa sp. KB1]